MFNKKYQSISLTLFLLILTVFVFAPTVGASSYASGGVSRRDHAALKRFVKRRAPPNGSANSTSDLNTTPDPESNPLAAIGVSSDPGSGSGPGSIISNTTSVANSTLNTTTPETSTTTNTTTTTPLPTGTSSVNSTTTTNSTSTTSTSTSTTTSSSSTTSTTSQQSTQQQSQSSSSPTTSSPSSTETLTKTETTIASPSTTPTVENDASTSGGLSSTGKTTLITVLIVVAASVGGVAILWTVFRKWKLGRSKKFDQRLQPIDWQPTVDDDFLPHRPGPDSASFRSQSDNQSTTGYGATSSLTRGLEHDFTAGPSHLTPVGGYADLARGPSPQPHMQEALSRGASLTRPNYDNSVPLHHQNSYGVQPAY